MVFTFDEAGEELKVVVDDGIELVGSDVENVLQHEATQLRRGLVRYVQVEGDEIAQALVAADLARGQEEHFESLLKGTDEGECVPATVPVVGEGLIEKEGGDVGVVC